MDFSQYNLLVIGYPSDWKVATPLIGAKACSKLLVSMFTGIIQNLGVLRRRRTGVLEVEVPASIRERLTVGASIAVNGVCVTVSELSAGTFSAGISQQTLSCTTIGRLKERTPVNLELPVGPERAFDGHIVLGHVDTIGRVRGFFRAGEGRVFIFSFR
jgi:riboflavin synthase